MKKRTIMFILFGVVFALSLFGCGKKNNNSTKKDDNKTEERITNDKGETVTKKESESSYIVNFVNYDDTLLYTYSVKEGDIPSYSMSNPYRPEDELFTYSFSGWIPKLAPIYEDTTYVAQYNKKSLSYTINFDLNGGVSQVPISSVKTNYLNKNIFNFNIKKDGYAFKGWSYNGEIIFDAQGNKINTVAMADNMTFKAEFSNTATLTIFYTLYEPKNNSKINTYFEKQNEFGSISETKIYNYNTNVNLFADLNEGYEFVGWYCDGIALSNISDYNCMVWEEDFTIEARLKLKTYTLNLSSNHSSLGYVGIGSGNNHYESTNTNAYYFENVSIFAYTRTDLRFLGWFDTHDELVSRNAIYSFNMKNCDYNLKAVWEIPDELKNYNFSYNLTNGFIITGVIDKTLNEYIVPDYVSSIDSSAFSGCSYIVSIKLPISTLKGPIGNLFGRSNFSGSVSTDQYYSNNGSTTYYYIPSSLKRVTLTGSGSLSIGAFSNCSNLTHITIPDGVTSIGSYAYYGCSLTNITIPKGVTSIENFAFSNCSNLTHITIPDGVTSIASYAFFNCSSLTNITIPNSVTSIGNDAFSSCSKLTKIEIPNSVTTIGNSAFAGCTALVSISIPFVGDKAHTSSDRYQYPLGYIFGTNNYTGTTSTSQTYYGSSTSSTTSTTYYIPTTLKQVIITGSGYIQYGAFYNCSNITSVVIPVSITNISNYAFYNCTSLSKVYYDGTSAQWNSITIGSTQNGYLTGATRYYYSATNKAGNYWHYDDKHNVVEW